MMITGAFGNSYRGPQSALELTLVLDSASMTLVSKASPVALGQDSTDRIHLSMLGTQV